MESERPQSKLGAASSIHTTIGELVEIIMSIAMEAADSEQEACALASIAVNDLLLSHQFEA